MSQLLISAPKDADTGAILVVVGTAAPDHFSCGIPYDSAGMAVDDSSPITNYSMGLPFTANGRLAVSSGATTYYNSGAAPFDASGALVMQNGTVDHVATGIPYLAAAE